MRIVYHAKIYTLDSGCPTATAIAIDGDRVLAVGDDFHILKNYAYKAELLDASGYTIIPGLIDAHIHLEQFAFNLQKVDCDTLTREEGLARIAERAAITPPGDWILGHGWNQNNWADGFGNAEELDRVAPNHPVFLSAKSLHAAWTNSSALIAAAIGPNTPNPAGGKIGRNPDGLPNGILFESAMPLVTRVIPQPSAEQRVGAIRLAISQLSRFGLTGVHDFDQRECFAALQVLHDRAELSIRVFKSIPLVDLPHAVALGLRTGFGDNLLRIGGVKAFADGALGPRTAAMLQPYDGEPDNRGILLLDGEELFEIGRQAVDNGFSLAVHAIGDLANHEVLNAFEQLRKYQTPVSGTRFGPLLRHRIEHVQLIHPDDAARLAELGVVASMQPIHAPSDMIMADQFWGKRAANAYAWRTLSDHGTLLVFGSDAPVESPNPFAGLHAAISRRRADGSPGPEGWHSSQRLSRQEALRAYTLGPAYVSGLENHLGKLSPGYLADLLLLEEDPFTCDTGRLNNIIPSATMLGGSWVYQG